MTTINESIEQAINRLLPSLMQQGYEIEATHPYTDDQGQTLFYRLRLNKRGTSKKEIRPIHLNSDNQYVLGEPQNIYKIKPLYRLAEIIANTDAIVIIPEGEWCCDHLAALGIITTTSGGTSSANSVDWQPLSGRKIVVWPDNDDHGIKYANSIADVLHNLGCHVSIIDISVLRLPDKGDVVDWLQSNPKATCNDLLSLKRDKYQPTKDKPERSRLASKLIEFVKQRYELFHDANSQVYTQNKQTGHTTQLSRDHFKTLLLAEYYTQTKQTVSDAAVKEALSTLKGLALTEETAHTVYIRAAIHEGIYYLDLGEAGLSRAIAIHVGHWEVIDKPPVKFLRTNAMLPLPEPEPGGDMTLLWQLVNVPAEARLLVTTFFIDSLRVDTPCPILELSGYHGTAKSTTQELLRRVIDPSSCNLRGEADNIDDLFVSASKNWVISRENITHLKAKQQDALCIIATGGGHVKRELYTDDSEHVIAVKRPIILNGVSPVVTAPDLLDRTISVELPVITSRVEKREIVRQFEAQLPSILGGLLDIMASAMEKLPDITMSSLEQPRLFEYAKLGKAVAMSLGVTADDFMQQFNDSKINAMYRTIDAMPVAGALLEWLKMQTKNEYRMTAKELFDKLEDYRVNAWPQSPHGLSSALRKAAPILPYLGVQIEQSVKNRGYKRWHIKRVEQKKHA
ncbi:MAG: hypothetical protein GY821_09775 [Gammaproteobacteria bacterium]|nr:hypothetical protein [Gammaproteobacteria bacterium]